MFFSTKKKKLQLPLFKSLKNTHSPSPSLRNSESMNMPFSIFKSLTAGHKMCLLHHWTAHSPWMCSFKLLHFTWVSCLLDHSASKRCDVTKSCRYIQVLNGDLRWAQTNCPASADGCENKPHIVLWMNRVKLKHPRDWLFWNAPKYTDLVKADPLLYKQHAPSWGWNGFWKSNVSL